MIQKAQIKKKKQQPNLKNESTQAHENHRRSHSNEKLQEKQPRTHHFKLQKQGKGRER